MQPAILTDKLRAVSLPDLATAESIALQLGVTPSSVRALFRSGAIPGRKLGRRWVASRVELLASLSRPANTLRLMPRADHGL